MGASTYSILRHMDRQSTILDLGIQTQVVWNTAQGRPFESSIEVSNYLGDHLSLVLGLLAPLYWVWPDVRLLLAFQAVALALGAYPVYRLARQETADERVGLAFALAYLLYPAVGFLVRFDFHAEALVAPLLLAGLWCWRAQKTGPALLWFLLALLCREETGLVLAALGVVLALRSRGPERRLAWQMGLIGLAWTVLGMGLVMPHLRGQPSDTFLACFEHLGPSYGAGLLRLVRDPLGALAASWQGVAGFKATLLPRLLLPLAFLPLVAPGLLAPLLPSLLPAIFSRCLPHSTIYYQYTAPMIPFLFWAGIEGFRRAEGWLLRLRRNRATGGLLAGGPAPLDFDFGGTRPPFCRGAGPPTPPVGGLQPPNPRIDASTGADRGFEAQPTGLQSPEGACIYVAGGFTRRRTLLRAVLLLLVLLGTAGALVWDFPWWKPVEGPGLYTVGRPEPRDNDAAFHEAAALIPPDAALATDNTLGPQFAHRRAFYFFPYWEAWRADYVLVDLQNEPPDHDVRGEALSRLLLCPLPPTGGPSSPRAAEWCRAQPDGFSWSAYGVRYWRDGILLLQRGWPVDPALHREVRLEW